MYSIKQKPTLINALSLMQKATLKHCKEVLTGVGFVFGVVFGIFV
jgi:hypothetical protein